MHHELEGAVARLKDERKAAAEAHAAAATRALQARRVEAALSGAQRCGRRAGEDQEVYARRWSRAWWHAGFVVARYSDLRTFRQLSLPPNPEHQIAGLLFDYCLSSADRIEFGDLFWKHFQDLLGNDDRGVGFRSLFDYVRAYLDPDLPLAKLLREGPRKEPSREASPATSITQKHGLKSAKEPDPAASNPPNAAASKRRDRKPRVDHVDVEILRALAGANVTRDDGSVWKAQRLVLAVAILKRGAAKSRCVKLGKLGLLGARTGAGGGVWITKAGLDHLQALDVSTGTDNS